MSLHLSALRRPWPFWLLIAAWFCANTPQAATLHFFLWVKAGENFSHQAQLSRSVAALLAGSTDSDRPEVAAPPAVPARPAPLPALPADALAKKIDLSLVRSARLVYAPRPAASWPPTQRSLPAAPVDDVPCPPPRTRA